MSKAWQDKLVVFRSAKQPRRITKQFTPPVTGRGLKSHTQQTTAAYHRAYVVTDAVASTEPFYGWLPSSRIPKASTFDGYLPAAIGREQFCIQHPRVQLIPVWAGNCCANDYAKALSHGLGMGDWNQITTKMTNGGDLYQTHIRKSRNISMMLAYSGDNQGELQANRKVILDALRPDLLSNLPVREQFGINMPGTWRGHEQRIIRYQGFDANGNEATEPIDIVCVFQPSHDTPDTRH